ncbi:MAG: hypothetical protein C7B47_10510 [Sulfobacillus thermosulfidooxidans]|uniref:Uncharacterized protein n=1 Tax=Sulfobacillus thermosulfidooxidans TaxID=28034 RepID=A0A2T2WW45_SULTH|nr:MAG: hypothetical protein C7B47_10510 [Sulfobacillus thermosulfidooxidans]
MALPSTKTPGDLLRLLILPLIDGYFLSMVLSGRLDNISAAMLVGILAFSGAGVVTTASLMSPQSSPSRYLIWTITRVYLLLLPAAWLITLLVGPLQSIELPYQGIFTALILVGTASNLWPTSLPVKLQGLYRPAQLMGILISVMVLYGLKSGRLFHVHWQFDPFLLMMTTISVGIGFVLTISGSLLQYKWGSLNHPFSRQLLAAGGSIVLLLVSLTLLGVPIPSTWLWIIEGIALSGSMFSTHWPGRKPPISS